MTERKKKLTAKAALKKMLDLFQTGKVEPKFGNAYSLQDWRAFLEHVDKDVFVGFDHNGCPKK